MAARQLLERKMVSEQRMVDMRIQWLEWGDSNEVIVACWQVLRGNADQHRGIDYLQVFESDDHDENLWFIEDGPGGAITALLPSDY